MNHNEAQAYPLRGVTMVMLWLFTLTVMMLVLPWQQISPDIAQRVQDNRLFLYVALMFELSNFLCHFVYNRVTRNHDRHEMENRTARLQAAIEGLDFSERAVLREFVLQRKAVLNLPLNETAVRNLVDNRVLRPIGLATNGKTPVIISKYARPFITYKAIGLSCGKLSAEQITQIMDARPSFAREPRPLPKAFRGSGLKIAA